MAGGGGVTSALAAALALVVAGQGASACEASQDWFAAASEAEIVDCITLDFLSRRADDQASVLQLAIEAGAGIGTLDLIREAARGGWPEMLGMVDDRERSALHVAVEAAVDPGVVTWLLAAGHPPDPLMRPIAVRRLRSDAGTTPLHLAAARPDGAAFVNALLAGGADADAEDAKGYRPIHLAAPVAADTSVLSAFLAHAGGKGSVFDKGDATKTSPLLTAAATDRPLEVIGFMLRAGADADHKNDEDATALHLAAERATDAAVVRLLLDHVEDPCTATETVASPMDLLAGNVALATDADLRRAFHETCVEGR